MELPLIENLREVILSGRHLLDVRAPVEFQKGALPRAVNHPLIDDQERHQIGICYKELGQDAAIDRGHELVSGDRKAARIERWEQFARSHPDGALYCWRGGMRSKISQQWLYEQSGILYPRIKGGYKALRHFLLEELERSAEQLKAVIIGGRTGVGKTLFLNSVAGSIDLEGLANHRGSAFGPRAKAQPGQADFENQLAVSLIRHLDSFGPLLLLEDEGRNIGTRSIPEQLFERMRTAPLLILEATLEERIDITYREYIDDTLQEYQQLYGEQQGFDRWADYLLLSIDKIQRRLGGERHTQLRAVMQAALDEHRTKGTSPLHRQWIGSLLGDYYDPMYDYQITKRQGQIRFKGDSVALRQYLEEEALH